MHVIPVIDLKDGLVVSAKQGKRQSYRPLATPLCSEPDILAVTGAYLSVFPFKTFYIADLNAIENNGNNHAAIIRILETYTDIRLWIDAGLDVFIKETSRPFQDRVSNILGSETGIAIEQIYDYTRISDCILSLDFDDKGFLGNKNLLEQYALLPQRLIIMSLGRVGRNAGPDLDRVGHLMGKLRDKQVYAAGGVRNMDDLRRLAERGIHGALLASALHNKTIAAEHLKALMPEGTFI